MQFPVHRNNLLPRGKQVDNYILIDHSYYKEHFTEVWVRIIGPYYRHKFTYPSLTPHREFVESIRKLHTSLHGSLPCKCSIGKAFTKLEGIAFEQDEV